MSNFSWISYAGYNQYMQHHAFVVEAEVEEGIGVAEAWVEKELQIQTKASPDVVILRHGLFSVEDARRVSEVAMQVPLRGESKVIIIAATRAYHEAQNALLKIFEEPPPGTHLFIILPSIGGLLPTLRSRVHTLSQDPGRTKLSISEDAKEFMKGTKEKRTALIKRLVTGRDDENRRENRDRAISIVDGVEVALVGQGVQKHAVVLSDIATLRGYLYDRSAPVKMILEHLSLVLPKSLL